MTVSNIDLHKKRAPVASDMVTGRGDVQTLRCAFLT